MEAPLVPSDAALHVEPSRGTPGEKTAATALVQRTADEIGRWLANAGPGETLEYHRGYLPMDRCIGSHLGADGGKELDRVAEAAMAMAEVGHVHLIQGRHGPGDYSYLVVASSGPVRRSGGRAGRKMRGMSS